MARARNTDPQTSHDAAKSLTDVTAIQGYVLRALRRPRTDQELVDAYRAYKNAPPATEDSTIRTRRNELVRRGLVVDTGERRPSRSGRKAIVWAAR